ncbi:MAG: hypothetical protein Q9220_006170 [cf. Caloplaca sp. 1 TL-2023]
MILRNESNQRVLRVKEPEDGDINSQLAVGYKHDESFVVRGSKIGVFKHTPNNNLDFSTNISKVETPGGKLFSPKKGAWLNMQDGFNSLRRIPMSSRNESESNPNSLFQMDLEYGKVVDEWKVHDDITVKNFAPEKLGLRAKTQLPALGDLIVGLDVSADGRWVLATCRTYLLIDALQSGKNEGKLGFEKGFAKDSKPQPRRLTLQPSNVAQFQFENPLPWRKVISDETPDSDLVLMTKLISHDFEQRVAPAEDSKKTAQRQAIEKRRQELAKKEQ